MVAVTIAESSPLFHDSIVLSLFLLTPLARACHQREYNLSNSGTMEDLNDAFSESRRRMNIQACLRRVKEPRLIEVTSVCLRVSRMIPHDGLNSPRQKYSLCAPLACQADCIFSS